MKFPLILVSIILTAIVGCSRASRVKTVTVLGGG